MRIKSGIPGIALLCCTASVCAATPTDPERLFYGEILFESLREHHFDALQKFYTGYAPGADIENSISGSDSLLPDKLTVTDLQIAFGINQPAKKIIAAKPLNKQQKQLRQHTAYQLAKYYYKKHRPVDVINTLDAVAHNTDSQQLRALAFIQVGKFKDAAKILESLTDNNASEYTRYNLGIAQLLSGDEKKARSILSSLGRIKSSNSEDLALKDKANLQLGQYFLDAGKAELAKKHFNLVRMEGPFTDQALLAAGWSSFSLGRLDRAVVPWSVLHEITTLNAYVIEAKMALPFAYAKLGAHGKAANLYGHAIELFEVELSGLEQSIDNIRNGKLTEEIINNAITENKTWYANIIQNTEKQQKPNLTLLFSTEKFRQFAETLHELAFLKHHINKWQSSITAYQELIRLKQKTYKSNAPEARKELSIIHKKINSLLTSQQQLSGKINAAQTTDSDISRLKQAYENQLQLRESVTKHIKQLPELKRQLASLSKKLIKLDNKLNNIITRAGEKMVSAAIEILRQKQRQLKSYHTSALFALAESYDFATRKQK